MFGSLTNFEGSLFDDLRRMQHEMEERYGPRVWPAGIRSIARGTYPPINLGATSARCSFVTRARCRCGRYKWLGHYGGASVPRSCVPLCRKP